MKADDDEEKKMKFDSAYGKCVCVELAMVRHTRRNARISGKTEDLRRSMRNLFSMARMSHEETSG